MFEVTEQLIREGLAHGPRVASPVFVNLEYSALRLLVDKAICAGIEMERSRGEQAALVGASETQVECVTTLERDREKQAA